MHSNYFIKQYKALKLKVQWLVDNWYKTECDSNEIWMRKDATTAYYAPKKKHTMHQPVSQDSSNATQNSKHTRIG